MLYACCYTLSRVLHIDEFVISGACLPFIVFLLVAVPFFDVILL